MTASTPISGDRPSSDTASASLDIELIDWTGPSDPSNPFNWPVPKKVLITTLCLLATLSCNANSTALTVAWRETNPLYNISDATFPNSYWTVTLWTLGGCFSMAFLLPLTEDYSIRWGYLSSYLAFILFTFPQALTSNYAGFLVLRFLAGASVAMVANFVVGIACDIWEGERGRHIPVASFITVYLVGSALGPVVGAAVLAHLHWTWIVWVQVIWHAVLFVAIALSLEETRGEVILRRKAGELRRKTGRAVFAQREVNGVSLWDNLVVAVKRPIWMLLTEYVVFTFTIWSAFAVGMVFLFTQSTELVFSEVYGWSSIQAGYVQGATAIGMILAWFASFYSKHLYFASAERNTEQPGRPIPEAHLYLSIFGCFFGIFGGMFVYGWTAYPHIPWIAPAIGLAMVGFGINAVVMAIGAYLTVCYSKFALSACGIVGVGENIFAAFLPLATNAMYKQLGVHWPSSILGILAIPIGIAPITLLIWGKAIRARSPFILQARYEEGEVLTEKASTTAHMALTDTELA